MVSCALIYALPSHILQHGRPGNVVKRYPSAYDFARAAEGQWYLSVRLSAHKGQCSGIVV